MTGPDMIAKLLMILRKMRELSGIEAFEMTLARQPSQGLIPCLQGILCHPQCTGTEDTAG